MPRTSARSFIRLAADWCATKYGEDGTTYRRLKSGERCKQNVLEGSGILHLRRDGFIEEKMTCKLIRIKDGPEQPVLFRCVEPGFGVWMQEYTFDLTPDDQTLVRVNGESRDIPKSKKR
jgi:hypothetical protein